MRVDSGLNANAHLPIIKLMVFLKSKLSCLCVDFTEVSWIMRTSFRFVKRLESAKASQLKGLDDECEGLCPFIFSRVLKPKLLLL